MSEKSVKAFRISDLSVCEIPNAIACLPEGTMLIPACKFEEGRAGWVIMPPETALENEEKFKEWRDAIYNEAIDVGMRLSKMAYPATVVSVEK